MARNDVVLLDSILQKASPQLGEQWDVSERFELFCFDQVLKDSDLSFEELESAWTDGTDDGGIDAFYVIVDGKLTGDANLDFASRLSPSIQVVIFTVRHSDSFSQDPINSLLASLPEIFDLTKAEDQLSYPFSPDVLSQRSLFHSIYTSLADRRPELSIDICFCSRGDARTLAENLTARADAIVEAVRSLFSDARVSFSFLGATELLQLARRQPTFSLRLRYIETYISREGKNYVLLVRLPDYYSFIRDERGNLRRYLFDSNVRDYLGDVQINRDIMDTLRTPQPGSPEDFWWLNNGVTIIATHATVAGKEISLENVQIVNGLQTTETIFQFYSEAPQPDDDRAILVKVLLAAEDSTRARIIKATNYQNSVDLSSLRGLDKIQRDLEHFLFDNGWFYDRRKNFYKNQGRPADRIVSMPYLAAAVRAVALGDPARSPRQRARSLTDDQTYSQVFNPSWDLRVYLVSLEITRAVEVVLHRRRMMGNSPPLALVNYVSYLYTCSALGVRDYLPSDTPALVGHAPTSDHVLSIREDLLTATRSYQGQGKKYQGILLSREFIEQYVASRYPTRQRHQS